MKLIYKLVNDFKKLYTTKQIPVRFISTEYLVKVEVK